jgi:glucose-6-phosphate 1-dehydrogenase
MKALDPCTLVFFGAGGNLSRRKLIPALFHLETAKRLPEQMVIMGCDIVERNRKDWQDFVRDLLREQQGDATIDESTLQHFCDRLYYLALPKDDDGAYNRLQKLLEEPHFPPNILYYMAVRPVDYPNIVDKLGDVGLLQQKSGWRRVVIEKPFGYDLLSAQATQASLQRHLIETQIYRIDHYLGKETVQNVMVFRFANLLLEPLWNHHYIDHVQITHSETIGVDGRADYYEGAGALRDMVQSHLLQLLALVAMEPPVTMDAEHLRDEKVKLFKAIRPITQNAVHAHAFRAQYSSGTIEGKTVPAYLDEKFVAPNSSTETYAALKLFIDNWRWAGVPFYLRTGKRLAENRSAICIRFKDPPQDLFRHTRQGPPQPNWIMLGIQPDDCMKIELQMKVPGLDVITRSISLDAMGRKVGDVNFEAYESLLLDVILGDHSLFLRMDEVEAAWRVIDPILKLWSVDRGFINTYPAGSWGPRGTYRLFDREDQFWRHSLDLSGADLQAY